MSGPFASADSPRGTATTPVFLTTFALILAAIGAMLVIDLWLARIDSRESEQHAGNLFNDGQALLAAGKPSEAADLFASAQSLERANVRYSVALAEAMLADGHASQAETELSQTLRRAETDGLANLVMARIETRLRHLDRAASFYHRAIYGSWSGDVAARRLAARLELIDLLSRGTANAELLAELLPLEDIDPDSVGLRRRLGHLFLRADSPQRAIPIFRDLLKRDPRDGDAYAGIGEAALALGNFRTARADLAAASRLLGDSGRVVVQLMTADTALALDPTGRGIGASARLQRSRAFLQRTLDATTACARTDVSAQLADSARRVLALRDPLARVGDETVDELLDLASSLWAQRGASCPRGDAPAQRALALVHDKLQG
jgi:tetratricopeptide (TPR) repeat protein